MILHAHAGANIVKPEILNRVHRVGNILPSLSILHKNQRAILTISGRVLILSLHGVRAHQYTFEQNTRRLMVFEAKLISLQCLRNRFRGR